MWVFCFACFGSCCCFWFFDDVVTDWTMYRSFTRSLLKPLNLQAAMYALISQLTLVCNMQLNVLDDLAEAMKALDGKKKLLDKACQKLRGIPDIPPQRITDLETAIRQLRQLSCILDSCTISASYEVSQAQKALLLMPRTAKGASTSSDELNAQVSLPTHDEYHVLQDQDQLQEH